MRRPLREPIDPEELVRRLAAARIGATVNQYRRGPRAPLLRERLAAYLAERASAPILLVGEAPGWRGARISGLPFTSERQLTGTGPAEASATIVRRTLDGLDAHELVLLWNAVPTHPGTATGNRVPTAAEIAASLPFLEALAAGRLVVPVGRVAERACGAPGIRHPSHGGAAAFRAGLAGVLEGIGRPRVRDTKGTAIIHRRSAPKPTASLT